MTPSGKGGSLQVVDLLVDLIGIEPMTSSMPWKRAPSCATGPHEEGFLYSLLPSSFRQTAAARFPCKSQLDGFISCASNIMMLLSIESSYVPCKFQFHMASRGGLFDCSSALMLRRA